MSLLTNVLWGGIFCLPSGFSFVALRLSTLCAALLAMWGVYLLLKLARAPEWLAVMAALVLGFNPIFFPLSCSFMTDVLFVTVCVFAAFFLVRNLMTGKDSDLIIGTVIAVFAILSRQLGLAVPFAFAIVACLKHGFRGRNLWRAMLPAVVGILALVIFQHWMSVTGRLPSLYTENTGKLTGAVTHPLRTIPLMAFNIYVSLLYLGLFLLPVSFCVLATVWTAQKKKVQLLFAVSLWVLLLMCYFYRSRAIFMPLSTNILTESGIGPFTLRDAYLLQLNLPPELPGTFWKIVTLLSLFGAAVLTTLIGLIILDVAPKLRPGAMNDRQATAVFLLLGAAIYLAPLLFTDFYDRYLMLPIPFIAVAIAGAFQPFPRLSLMTFVPVTAVLVAMMFFTVCTSRDYLMWNRLRWVAANDLMTNEHVQPDEMDGGFEFNGLYFFVPHYDFSETKKSWWWVQKDTYLISFGPVPGYNVMKEYQYSHWLPSYTGKVVVSKKSPVDAGVKN